MMSVQQVLMRGRKYLFLLLPPVLRLWLRVVSEFPSVNGFNISQLPEMDSALLRHC